MHASATRVVTCFLTSIMGTAVTEGGSGNLITDRFGRVLDDFGVVLVDWEGHLANPAIELWVQAPPGADYPVQVTLSADHERLYFDEPSTVGATGPTKSITLTDDAPVAFRLSIFPDRDGIDETYTLDVMLVDSSSVVTDACPPISVKDHDTPAVSAYEVTVNYTQDDSGFFGGADERAVIEQAAADWAFFIDDMDLDTVSGGGEITWIWAWPLAWTGGPGGAWVGNAAAYDGFLVYGYGINTAELRSGGEPSSCCFHASGGEPTPLRRSGGVEVEIAGNYNELGWLVSLGDDEWWVSGNFGNEQNDLYSIVHHELGHALAFNSAYPEFETGERDTFDDAAVVAYYGGPVAANAAFDHFEGVVDPVSGYGCFGNEYFGDVPRRRWLITKLDLLLMESVGYVLRPTSAFAPLAIEAPALPAGAVDDAYNASLVATGGIPFYDWVIESGTLPPGLALDRFTGEISGTPTASGCFTFTVRVFDYDDGPGVTANATIEVSSPCAADLDGNGNVGFSDLTTLLLHWGSCPSACPWDIDANCTVGFGDLTFLLLAWGPCD